jgi:DNA-directed RNA polymerase subunit L
MDLEITKKEKNEIEIKIKEEDTSFFYLIENIASSKRDVEFVALKKSDHLVNEFSFYIRTKGKAAKDVLLECISEAEENFLAIVNNLEKITQDA